jgi:hypothetical protein
MRGQQAREEGVGVGVVKNVTSPRCWRPGGWDGQWNAGTREKLDLEPWRGLNAGVELGTGKWDRIGYAM